ncbi:hypothetical protein [Methylorubrum extorquens]|nr:hypothetical protein [Methylorubrum extorquens]MCP1591975.1 hypothetical protein [Methylorubrum extorquens]
MRRFQRVDSVFLMQMPPGDRGPTVRFHVGRHRSAIADLGPDSPEADKHRRALALLTKAAERVGIVIQEPADAAA